MDFESSYDTNGPELIAKFRELLVSRYGAESDLTNARSKVSRIDIVGSPDNAILAHSREAVVLDNVAQIKIKAELNIAQYYLDIDGIMQLLDDEALRTEFFNKIANKSSRVYSTSEQVYETVGLLIKFMR